jgi:hypothetical protein
MADRPTLITPAQMFARLPYTPTGSEADRAEAILVDASELIRDEAGVTWLNDDETAVEDVPHRVQGICRDVALRAYLNSEGLSQKSIGDLSKSYDRAGREGGEVVYLTDREAAAVRKAAGGTGGFVAATMVSPYNSDTLGVVPL